MNKELIARLRRGAGIERERVLYIGRPPLANEAADAIEALQAEHEQMAAADFAVASLKAERDTLRQQLAEAQRDAERYRHLFNGNQPSSQFARAYARWDGSDGKAGFDAAIDAAMKGAA
jgi:multidrug resistance efflux pump